MYIRQIEIDNFKSFLGKTVVPFEPGFTTISGPNGSGKSNIVDSILFCLGLSSSRTMRAEKLPDLINHHAKRREAIVAITFDKGQIDERPTPSEEKEQLEDETVEEGAELVEESPYITVARRIRDGASGYTSTYYLNGKTSTLSEIHDYLGRFNVSPGCYNVMMQGDVAGIVNMSPMERRKIIDEIAGVAEFDRKIDQAQRELEATNGNIERNQILLAEIEARVEQLSAERDKALKYKSLRADRQSYEAKLLAAKLNDLLQGLKTAKENLAAVRNQKAQSITLLSALETQLEDTREALRDVNNEVKRKGEDQQIAIRKQIEALRGHVSRRQDSIEFIEKQLKENAQSAEKMTVEIQRLQGNIEVFNGEIEGYRHQEQELQTLVDTEKKAAEKLNKKFDALTESGGEWTTKRSDIRSQMEAAEDKLAFMRRSQLNLESDRDRLLLNLELQQKAQAEGDEKRVLLAERHHTAQETLDKLTGEKEQLTQQIQQAQLKYSQSRVGLNSAQDNLNKLLREQSQLEARKRAYEEVNFSRAVEGILQSGIDGLHGTLAQLMSVNSDLSLAIEVSLGGRLQNMVVDNDRVAKEGIDHLKRNRLGRATFLPLNKVRPARSLPILPSGPGIIDFAFNLVDFDPQYADVMAYALGETLVMQDIDAARPLMQRYRMVTLGGSILEKTGAMTGGSMRQQGSGMLANTRQVEGELQHLEKRIGAQESECDELGRRLTRLETNLEQLKEQYGQTLNRHAQAQAECQALQQQLEELSSTQSPQSADQELEKRQQGLESQLKVLHQNITVEETTLEGLKGELEGIESQIPSDELNALKKELDEVQFQMNHYMMQLRNVESDIKDKERERQYQEAGIKDYQDRMQKNREQDDASKKERVGYVEEIQLTAKQIQDLEAQTSELDDELKRLQGERDIIQAKLLDQEKQKSQLERDVHQAGEQILSFQARCRELDPQIKLAKEEIQRTAELDPENLPAELPSEQEIQQAIQRLTRRMEALEPVNMLAVEEYDAVLERQTELGEKVTTLVKECETLTLKITGYEELKKLSFMKAFENADTHFKQIFAELSDGHGRLVLTNPEHPLQGGLTIEAQPRGKKTQRLEAMSGGEKSLTSLAFVFALQRYKPAPFYSLDEVDMNLDGLNVEKLANMLRRESRTAQFMVVSLRKPMIQLSDRTVGVTQKRNGITKVAGIKFRSTNLEKSDTMEEEMFQWENSEEKPSLATGTG